MYCDTEEHLLDVFPKISNYQGKKLIEEFVSVSGQADTYLAEGVGYFEKAFDAGVQLTVQTSIANVQSNAGSYYYISDTDLFYVHAFDSDDLTGSSIPKIELGVDWDSFKTRMRNNAADEMDGYLTTIMDVPLQPRQIKVHDTDDAYCSSIKNACAYLTCRNIVRRLNPNDPVANEFHKLVFNPEPSEGETYGIMDDILSGRIVLRDHISPREPGSFNVFASSYSGTGLIRILGEYEGAHYELWRLQIDTAGAPGTATWKLSYDQGSNFDKTLEETFDADNDERRIDIYAGLQAIFTGTFVENDYVDIEVFPKTDVADIQQISTSRLVR
jgi:hypothetical protein